MQRGVADIQALMAYMGSQWCGTPDDTVAALDHTLQAVAYLLKGKDECAKKASKVTSPAFPIQRCPLKDLWKHHTVSSVADEAIWVVSLSFLSAPGRLRGMLPPLLALWVLLA